MTVAARRIVTTQRANRYTTVKARLRMTDAAGNRQIMHLHGKSGVQNAGSSCNGTEPSMLTGNMCRVGFVQSGGQ